MSLIHIFVTAYTYYIDKIRIYVHRSILFTLSNKKLYFPSE